MQVSSVVVLLALLVTLGLTVRYLGAYMAGIYAGGPAPADRVFLPVERWIYRVMRVDPDREQRWTTYTMALLAFSLVSFVVLYALLRTQSVLPLNPEDLTAVPPALSFNTAVSFMTNTNWQNYGGEATMSYLSQMVGLAVQNFVSAAAGMAVAVALIRGLSRRGSSTIGNFWVDLTRTTTRILLPLSFVVAIALVAAGAIQNFSGYHEATTIEGAAQVIPGGPLASQVAIKQLGTNGGGFLNVNSIHPFENPNGLSNFLATWAILAIPLAFPYAYGRLVKDRKQGWAIFGAMFTIWLAMVVLAMGFEAVGNPRLTDLGVDQAATATQPGGSFEGKDVRIGTGACAIWAASTTGTSNGSVNCQHDSMTPLGGGVAITHMLFGEVSPGGVGVGINGLLILALLSVFIAGLMVGRTPEYLGKKIQAPEVKLVVLYILAMPLVVLAFAAISVVMDTALGSRLNPDAHGFSEILYLFTSQGNNNGSAFGGITGNTQWYNTTGGLAMLVGRFFLIIPTLAIAGSLGRKRPVPVTAGTFPTGTPLFAGLVVGVTVIVAGLTFFPALALGPIVEQLSF
jgi:K+-transporting ATPase ATPase A chain